MAGRPPSVQAFNARVLGRVLGVGFRYSALIEAKRLGLTGWVRNDDDGSVEVHAEGDPANLSLFASWLDSGPPGAYVERVDLHPTQPMGCFNDFSVEF